MKKHLLLIFVLTMLFGFGAKAQSNCAAPTGFAASAHNPQWNNVLLHWDAVADSTQEDIMWSTTTLSTRIGTNGAADFIGTVRFTPTELASFDGRYLTSVTFVPGEAQSVCTYSIVVWQGGSQTDDTTFNEGTMVVNQEITAPLTTNALNTVPLDTALLIDVTQELWIGIRCNTTAGYPLGASNNGGVPGMGELLYIDNEWETLTNSNLTDYNWLIIGHLQNPENLVTSYNLYRDNTLLSSMNATSFIDSLEAGTYQYDLTATYFNNCESDPVTVSVTMTDYPCANCQDTLIVGNETNTTYYIPINTYYNYSFSEQIYTADELSDISGRINCISFQYIYSSDQEKDFVVYMGNTNKSSFSGGSDWVPVSQMSLVYQGTLNFTNTGEDNWVNIPFNVPFEYDGSSNLVVAVLNNTGSYVSSSNYTFNTHSASGKTLYLQRDSDPYDVNALPSGTSYSYRNNIRFLIGDPVVCPMPSHLTITDISAHGATASWYSNDEHNGYELVLVPEGSSLENESVITVNDTFYVFENLTDLTTYSVYLRANCSSENSSWVYPVTFTTDPTCTSPVNLTISQVSGTSALVSWEPAEVGATAYIVSYTEAGQESWISETVTDYQYMLTGLEPVTVYQVSVTSVCDEGNAPAATKTFTTHCLAGGEIPIGDGTTTNTYIPSYSFYNYGYSQQIYLSSEFNGPSNITSISMNMANLSQQRNYKIYLAHTTASDLSAGWATMTDAQLVFSSPQTLVQGWNTFDFITPFSYNGTDNLLVIFIDSTGSYVSGNSWYVHSTPSSYARYLYQDASVYPLVPASSISGTTLTVRNNVIFGGNCDETITCIAPNAYLSDVTSESMTLNWVPGYMENSWEAEYCTDTANWISLGTLTTSPYIIDNLMANTMYTVRMRSVCGGDDYSYWTTMQVRTACDDITVLPYTESFDSYGTGTNAYPSCWGKINTYSGSYPYITTTNYSGPGSLYFYAGTSGTHNIAVTPPFSSELPMSTLQATFMYLATNNTDMLIVGVMTNPEMESTFVPVDTVYPGTTASTWVERRVTFNQYTGEGQYIAFKNQYGSTYNYGYIDNLVVEEMEDCPQPMQLSAISTPTDTVYLSWDGANGTAWEILYGPSGFNPNNEDEENTVLIQGVTDNPYTITGLSGGVGYDFYVRTDCGNDGVSNWSTFPASAYPFSYAMGITGSDTLTGCGFTITDDGGPNGNYSNSCDFILVVNPSGPDSLVTIYGTFAGESSLDYLSIYNGTAVDENNLIQKVVSGTSGTVIHFGPHTSELGALTLKFHSDGSVVYPGFAAITSCVAVPNCPSPVKNSVVISNIDGHNATVSFTDLNPDHNSWTVYYKPSSESTWDEVVTTTTTVDLNNLDPETTYDVYVVTNCDTPDDVADATNTFHFTTAVACPAPQNITVSNIGMTSATVNWFSNADSYIIEYGEVGFTPGEGTIVTTTDNTYDLTGLTSSTTYTVYITADCGIEGNSSAASTTFNTSLCEVTDQCEYTFELYDSFGDGWNGGTLSVQQNGITVASITLSSGSYATEIVHLCDNLSTSLLWNAGSYVSEVGFTLIGPDEEEIYSINDMTGYTTFNFTTSCTMPTCPKPTSIAVSNIGTTSAEVSWVSAGSESAWNLEYKESTENTWTVIPVTTNPYTLTGLTALTNYNVRVQADCGGGDVSDYRETSFATASCEAADQCTYTFILTDSYGDGWNNGYLTVEQNGVTVATLEAIDHDLSSTQTYDTVTVNLCDGISTSLVWHSGNYDSEAGFTLNGPDGGQIHSESGMSGYTTFTFTTDCNGTGPVITDPTVATVAASAIEQTTATLNASITNPDNVTITAKGFEWKATTGGTFTQIAGTGTGNNFTANLTGLTPSTGYTYKAFITYNGTTVYGSEMTFTTLEQGVEPCDVPTGLTANNITKESFDVSWNANANVSSWNIRYRVVGGQWTTATVNTNQYAISGLTAETNYEVQVQADCGNNNLSDWSETLNVTTLVDGINSYLLNSITLYPNPAKDVVNVQCTLNNVQCVSVEVFDVYGKVINTVNVVENPTRINVSNLANGMYFVRVTTDEGAVTKTFVKR